MTPDAAKAMYRRQLAAHGEPITLRRPVQNGAPIDAAGLRARVVSFQSAESPEQVRQGVRKVILLAEDLEATSWPGPPRAKDQVILRGKTMRIVSVDDDTRRVAGVLIAYELTAQA